MAPTSSTAPTSTARLEQLLPQLFQPDSQTGDRYLRINIAPNLPALIALEDVQESAWIPTHMVTPIPNLPACVLGVMNARNQVLCVVSLAQLLQIPVLTVNRQYYSMLTVRLAPAAEAPEETNLLALTVQEIQGILRLQPKDIESTTGDFGATLTPFLRGRVRREGQSIPVLDVKAIAAAPALSCR